MSVLLNALTGNLTGESYTIIASIPTTTTLTATPNASTGGMLVTFTATVAPSPANLGTVTFKDNGIAIDGATTIAVVGGVATFQVSTLTGGTHTITADYSGAAGSLPSTSNALNFVIACAATSQRHPQRRPARFRRRPTFPRRQPDGGLRSSRSARRQCHDAALHTNNVSFGGAPMPTGIGAIPTLTVTPSTDFKTWTITFSGPNVETGAVDLLSSLKDGVYDLNIDATKVHPNGMPAVNMVGNSTTRSTAFLATPTRRPHWMTAPRILFAAVVNTGDNLDFRNAFNKPSGGGYQAYFDFEGDGAITSLDNLRIPHPIQQARRGGCNRMALGASENLAELEFDGLARPRAAET